MAKLDSVENIVEVYDYFEENNTAYIVMEYVQGKTLKRFVKENDGKISEDVAIHIACSVLIALQHVQDVGIILGDISPDHIYICENLQVELIALGILTQEIIEERRGGDTIFLPGFEPPEQYAHTNRQGAWTDVYSVGAIAYYMLTGIIPPCWLDRIQMVEMLDPLEEIVPSISKNFSDAIMKAMSLNTRDRFSSAKDFLKALLNGEESQIKKKKVRRKKAL